MTGRLRILVTGSSGLLGTPAAKMMSEKHEVFSIFNEHLPRFGIPVKLDLLNLTTIGDTLSELKPNAIVHCAALADVNKCEVERELATRLNFETTEVISNAAAKLDSFVLLVSTDYVFDGAKGMYREDDETNPVNYYGRTKLEAEQCLKSSGAKYCIARTSTVFGPKGSNGKGNFALSIIERLRSGQQMPVITDQTVSPSNTSNVAEMVTEIVERKLDGTFHVSGTARVSRLEFARVIAQVFDLDENLLVPTTMAEMSGPAKRPRDSSLNTKKATDRLEHRPLYLNESVLRFKTELER